MRAKQYYSFTVLALSLLFANVINAQNPVNWTSNQLIEPAHLAELITNNKPLPVILSVGPAALIPHSINIGAITNDDNAKNFRSQISNMPKDTAIVVYCGCCPFEHCPNARPAIAILNEMGFTKYKLLDLPKNIKTDWLDKGYPTSN